MSKIMNKGLQIYKLKEYFVKEGYKNNLDKIDFDQFFDSKLDYRDQLRNMILIVSTLGLEKDGKPEDYYGNSTIDPDARDEKAEDAEKERKLLGTRKKLCDEFNIKEGLELEEKELDALFSKCDDLLEDLIIIQNLDGTAGPPNTLPPRGDYTKIIKEISEILTKKPTLKPTPSINVDGIRSGGSSFD